MKHDEWRGAPQPGPLARLLAFGVGTVLLIAALMFSLLVFAFALAAGLLAWGYLWWKTREVRRRMREQQMEEMGQKDEQAPGGRVIEGEAIREYTDNQPPR